MNITQQPPASPGETPALDPEIVAGLLELADEDDDFVRELYGSYVQSYRKCLGGLRQAIATSDAEELRRHAHTLKGASANVGASRIADCCFELQRLAAEGQLDSAVPWVNQVEDEFARVLVAIAEHVSGFDAP